MKSWYFDNDLIKDSNGDLICTIYPNVDPFYTRIVKKTPDIFELVTDFFWDYETRKKVTKKL